MMGCNQSGCLWAVKEALVSLNWSCPATSQWSSKIKCVFICFTIFSHCFGIFLNNDEKEHNIVA